MQQPGPRLETLLRRLSECPSDFIDTCKGTAGAKQIVAILRDHFRELRDRDPIRGDEPIWKTMTGTRKPAVSEVRYWGTLAVATWLLHDDWFLHRPEYASLAWNWLQGEGLRKLSGLVNPQQCIADPDRREELARMCLHALGLRPEGETVEQAMDRKGTLDSVERQRVLQETAEAERRAREVREALARKQALESASRYGE